MKYEKPEVDVIVYENVDIITLSGGEILPPVPDCSVAVFWRTDEPM